MSNVAEQKRGKQPVGDGKDGNRQYERNSQYYLKEIKPLRVLKLQNRGMEEITLSSLADSGVKTYTVLLEGLAFV